MKKIKQNIGIIIGIIIFVALVIAIILMLTSNPNAKAEKCGKNSINVVVTVNQWTSLGADLLGECATVDTIINGTDVDPHEFEPSASDISQIEKADFLIVNGLGYDEWALKAANNAKKSQKVINIGDAAEKPEGANPHLWFDTSSMYAYVKALKEAYEETKGKSVELDGNYAAVTTQIDILQVRINQAQQRLSENPFIETEGVAEYLLQNLRMSNKTPEAYLNAVNNDPEPSINAVEEVLGETPKVFFLFYNTQEENEVTKEIRRVAEDSGDMVIEVTEQMPVEFNNLTSWLGMLIDSIDLRLQGNPNTLENPLPAPDTPDANVPSASDVTVPSTSDEGFDDQTVDDETNVTNEEQ